MPPQSTQVSLQDVALAYPGAAAPAVSNLSLELEAGAITALLGPSGGGKTTILKLIAGLLTPDAGTVTFDGADVAALAPERRGAAMVFQNNLLFPHLSVRDNVGFGLAMRGLPRDEIATRVEAMLTRMRIRDLAARMPAEISGGQQQRVALARALIIEPRVLLLDEPLSNLDAHLRDEMRALIRSAQRDAGVTTCFVTHDQQEAAATADRVAVLLDGAIRQTDAPAECFERPADLAVARFLGAANFIDGHSDGERFDCALGRLSLAPGRRVGPGVAVIRPESIRLAGREAAGAMPARVVEKTYLGSQARLVCESAGLRLLVLTAPIDARALTVGDAVGLVAPAEAIWIAPLEK